MLANFAANANDQLVASDLNELKSKIIQNPDDKSLRIDLVEYYYNQGNISEALNEVNKLKQSQAPLSTWALVAAKLYIAANHYDKAIDVIHELGDSLDSEQKWILLGNAYLAQGQVEKAKSIYHRVEAETLDKNVGLARVAILENDMAGAQQRISAAKSKLQQSPNAVEDSKVHTLEGVIYRDQKQWDKALLNYEKAISLNDKNLVARLQYTSLLWGLKDKERFKKAATELYQKAPQHSRAMYFMSIVHLQDGNTAQAQKILNESIAQYPNLAQSYLLLSRIYYDQQKYLLAEQNIKTFMKLQPDHVMGTKLAAAIALRIGQASEAVELLEPLEKTHQADANYLALYGTALLLDHKVDKGQTYLEKAQALGMNHPAITTELAISHLQQGDTSEGQALLQKVIDSESENIQADVLLALSLADSKSYSKALQVAQQIIDKKPELPAAYNLKGMIYEKTQNFTLAKELYQTALQKDPNFVLSQNNLSELYIVQEAFKEAETNLKMTLKRHKDDIRAHLLMAYLKEKMGQSDEAVKWYEKAKATNTKAILPRMQYIEYFIRKGDFKKADFEADKLYQQHTRQKNVLSMVGKLKLQQKKYKEALEIYKNWLSLEKENPYVKYMLAKISLNLNDYKDANAYVDQILGQYQQYVPALLFKAELLLLDNKLSEAQKYVARALNIVPESDYAHKLMGKINLLKKNPKESLKHFQAAYRSHPSMSNVINLYQSLSLNGQSKKGFELLEQWAEQRPKHLGIKRFLASESLNKGYREKALSYYEALANMTTNDVVTYNNLAALNIEQDLDKALAYAEKAYRLAPDEPMIADTLGWVLVKKKSPEKALPLLEQAFRLAPDELEIGYHLAMAHYELGSKGQAFRILAKHENDLEKSNPAAWSLFKTLKEEMSTR